MKFSPEISYGFHEVLFTIKFLNTLEYSTNNGKQEQDKSSITFAQFCNSWTHSLKPIFKTQQTCKHFYMFFLNFNQYFLCYINKYFHIQYLPFAVFWPRFYIMVLGIAFFDITSTFSKFFFDFYFPFLFGLFPPLYSFFSPFKFFFILLWSHFGFLPNFSCISKLLF